MMIRVKFGSRVESADMERLNENVMILILANHKEATEADSTAFRVKPTRFRYAVGSSQ